MFSGCSRACILTSAARDDGVLRAVFIHGYRVLDGLIKSKNLQDHWLHTLRTLSLSEMAIWTWQGHSLCPGALILVCGDYAR